jgi:hypothetical protein
MREESGKREEEKAKRWRNTTTTYVGKSKRAQRRTRNVTSTNCANQLKKAGNKTRAEKYMKASGS